MDLKALQYFAAAAQYGSIAKAAGQLNVAQPAVSRLIRKLERDLGAELLIRSAQGVTPTGEGQHLLARTAPVLQLLKQTREEVRTWNQDPAGPVSIALMPSVAPVVAPILVRRVRSLYPRVQLHLSEGLGTVITDGVLTGQFDLGLFHADREVPSLAITHLLDEPMFLIGPATDGRAGKGTIGLRDLANFPLLLPEAPNPIRREIVNSTAMLKAMVAAGQGYTIQSYSFFHEETQHGTSQFRVMEIAGMSRNWSLARLEGRPAGGAVLAVAGIITEIAHGFAEAHYRQPAAG